MFGTNSFSVLDKRVPSTQPRLVGGYSSALAVRDVHVQNPCLGHLSTEALTIAMNIENVDRCIDINDTSRPVNYRCVKYLHEQSNNPTFHPTVDSNDKDVRLRVSEDLGM